MGSVDQKSYEQSEAKIKAVLLVASFLKFDTVLDPESLQKKTGIIKIMTLLTLFTFKAQIIKLVDELQKLEKTAVSQEVIKGMFQISKFCSNTNNQNTLAPISNYLVIQSSAFRLLKSWLHTSLTKSSSHLLQRMLIHSRLIAKACKKSSLSCSAEYRNLFAITISSFSWIYSSRVPLLFGVNTSLIRLFKTSMKKQS